MAVGAHSVELIAVKVVSCSAAFSKKEPVWALCSESAALMEKTAERGDAGARSDHDDGCIGVFGKPELLVRLYVNRQPISNGYPIGEECGADSSSFSIVGVIANNSNRRMNLASVRRGTRRD